MAEVGEQRLRAGEAQHHGPQHGVAGPAMAEQQPQPGERVERGQHRRMLHGAGRAQDGDGGEPEQHDRAEIAAHPLRPDMLEQEQCQQDADRERHDERPEAGAGKLQALHGGQHGDRGRDHAVAVEQGGAEQHQQGEGAWPGERKRRHLAADQAEQRQGAALPVMVGPQDEAGVFHADDEDHRPDDQRQYADDRRRVVREGRIVLEALLDGVERAGADVAEHDAQRPERHDGQSLLPVRSSGFFWHGLLLRRGRWAIRPVRTPAGPHHRYHGCGNSASLRPVSRYASSPSHSCAATSSVASLPPSDGAKAGWLSREK